ncbi:hypothetical protein IVB22_10855 [Bradyrhizobium sp. 190]|uniref:hypothetical protein n=1 Tax=Bradyrhizobium sp. 190 TaxID=2782658 RepID=UPI001FFBDE47|nr:hypothetical protein [Bradyrhizobium sp. 190]MCK1513063.1 hypothetical protein [Bradyrhizobium sp. 190]
MENQPAKIATICGCIDHCFSYAMWCEDFAPYLDPDDMIWGLDRAAELLSDATRLQSFLALRKLDDFFGGVKPRDGDLTAADFGIDVPSVLGEVGATFLSKEDEREKINKGVAHLTEELSLDDDSEVDLHQILKRSIPVLTRLVAELRKREAAQEATYWLDRTDDLIKRGKDIKTPAEKLAEAQAG